VAMKIQPLPILARPNLSRQKNRRSAISRLSVAALVVALLTVCAAPLIAAEDPMAAVKGTVDQVLSIVTDPAYKSATSERRAKLREVILPHFDFSDMARSAMGYHWRSLTQAQRDQFVRVFTDLLAASYMGKIEGYKGQKIVYLKETQDGDLSQVNTNILQPGSDAISVNYRLKNSAGTWKVYDVLVDQISLVGNYRNQFNRIMNNKGYDSLIKAISQKVQSIDAGN
jgi:phospholipid transport system substrate-binding protein